MSGNPAQNSLSIVLFFFISNKHNYHIYKFTVYFFIYIQDTDRHVTTDRDDSHSLMTRSSHHYRYSQLTRARSIKLTVWRIHSAGWTHINVVCTVSETFMASIWYMWSKASSFLHWNRITGPKHMLPWVVDIFMKNIKHSRVRRLGSCDSYPIAINILFSEVVM